MDYLKSRLKERDTQTVLGAAVYTVTRALVPPHWQLAIDVLAGVLGMGVAATPLPPASGK